MSEQPSTLATNGAAAAALLAGAIGTFALGLFVLLNELGILVAPSLYAPAGGVSGRTTMAVVVWLIAWLGLHRAWRAQQVNFGTITVVALVLIALGLVTAFPPVWGLLGA